MNAPRGARMQYALMPHPTQKLTHNFTPCFAWCKKTTHKITLTHF